MGILALVSAAAALVTPPLRVSPRAHVCANANAKVTFEEAQDLGSNLASILAESCAAGEPMPAEAVSTLRALVSSTPGARGWFVSLLTNPDYDAVFQLPLDEALLSAIESSPDPNLKLLTMNVAMSTATELVHLANGNPDLAAASALTRARSGVLLGVLHGRMPGLSDEVASLLSAVQPWSADGAAPAGADAEWVRFTKKWDYDTEQRDAIRAELTMLVGRATAEPEPPPPSPPPPSPPPPLRAPPPRMSAADAEAPFPATEATAATDAGGSWRDAEDWALLDGTPAFTVGRGEQVILLEIDRD